MSDVYRAEIVLPSSLCNRVIVDMSKATRRLMGDEPWIVRDYGYGTTDSGDWKDTAAEAWDAAADQLELVAAKYREAIDRCRAEAAKSRQEVASA